MKFDICTVGEILIDLTQSGVTAAGIPTYAANPGGAPANVAVAAARLGAKTAFIGRVGADSFGDFLRGTLQKDGVEVGGLSTDKAVPTTLAVVSVAPTGERSFAFYRSPGADLLLQSGDLPEETLANTTFLHFGSVSLTADPARTATLTAARRARELGALISYDPNYRASLWPNEAAAIAQMRAPLELVDVLKISDEELELLTGEKELDAGAKAMQAKGIRLVLITLGADGVYYRCGDLAGTVPGVAVKVADTNGAGDTFFGAALRCLAKRGGLEDLNRPELEQILSFANRAASITTSRPGAIPAMPTLDELE